MILLWIQVLNLFLYLTGCECNNLESKNLFLTEYDQPTAVEENSSTRTHYTAAVVEYEPKGNWQNSGQEIIALNLVHYLNFTLSAALNGADIIVFPEYGLTTLGIPRDRENAKQFLLEVPEIGRNPCGERLGSQVIQDLSCASKSNNIFQVLNLGEIRKCSQNETKCPSDGVFQYNTNVVIDGLGNIVAKYEKANLYFEDQFDKPDPVQLSTFETDFGKFGLFTCFDIIFHDPAIKLVESGVRNFIFPTAWVDELPFLTAIQAQASWAFSSNSNLLASGYHQPLGGQLGSGIYSGVDGAITYSFDSDSGSKMLIAELPIIPASRMHGKKSVEKLSSNIAAYHSFLREDLQNYTTKILDMNLFSERICTENGFCCKVKYQMKNVQSNQNYEENYRLIAFNGSRTVAAKTAEYEWQVCAVIRCLNNTLESCSENDKTSSELRLSNFQLFVLESNFDVKNDTKFLPSFNSLDIQFSLIPTTMFEMQTNASLGFMQVYSNSLNNTNVKTIAIINKIFEKKIV